MLALFSGLGLVAVICIGGLIVISGFLGILAGVYDFIKHA